MPMSALSFGSSSLHAAIAYAGFQNGGVDTAKGRVRGGCERGVCRWGPGVDPQKFRKKILAGNVQFCALLGSFSL
jgi:hypothetical protein